MLGLLAAPRLDGLCQGALYRPSQLESTVDGVSVDAGLLGPFDKALGFALERQQAIVATIAALNDRRRPTAILRAVRSIVVDAVKGHSRRAWPHVCDECVKGFSPTIADIDSTSTVHRIPLVPWITTAVFHTLPCAVFVRCGASFLASTSAVRGALTGEVLRRHGYSSAAFAATFPEHVSAETVNWTDSSQTSEPMSSEVMGARIKYDCLSHADPSLVGMGVVRGRWSLPTITGSAYYPTKLEAFA